MSAVVGAHHHQHIPISSILSFDLECFWRACARNWVRWWWYRMVLALQAELSDWSGQGEFRGIFLAKGTSFILGSNVSRSHRLLFWRKSTLHEIILAHWLTCTSMQASPAIHQINKNQKHLIETNSEPEDQNLKQRQLNSYIQRTWTIDMNTTKCVAFFIRFWLRLVLFVE